MKVSISVAFFACLLITSRCAKWMQKDDFKSEFEDLLRFVEGKDDVGVNGDLRERTDDVASKYIVEGTAVSPGKYPFMTSLFKENKFPHKPHCGGVLISENVVMTWIECTSDLVQIGKTDLTDVNQDAELFHVRNVHEQRYMCSDGLALLELEHSSSIPPIKFPSSKEYAAALKVEDTKVLGWGHGSVLSETNLKIMETGECGSRWKKYVIKKLIENLEEIKARNPSYDINIEVEKKTAGNRFDRMWKKHSSQIVCAFGDGKKASCLGDQGGPLLGKIKTPFGDQDVVLGVTSFLSIGCFHDTMPGIYTNVEFYRDWVLKTLASIAERTAERDDFAAFNYNANLGSIAPTSTFTRTVKSFSLMAVLAIPVALGVMATRRRPKPRERDHEVIQERGEVADAAAEELVEASEEMEREQARTLSHRIPGGAGDLPNAAQRPIQKPSPMSHNDY